MDGNLGPGGGGKGRGSSPGTGGTEGGKEEPATTQAPVASVSPPHGPPATVPLLPATPTNKLSSIMTPGEGHYHDSTHVHFDMSAKKPEGGNNKDFHEKSILLLSSRDMSVGHDPGLGVRHLVTLLCCLGCGMAYALRGQLGVAIVAMVKTEKKITISNNSSLICPYTPTTDTIPIIEDGKLDWDASTQGVVLSAFFYGAVVTQLLGGIVAERIGGKLVFGTGVFLMSILVILSPTIAMYNTDLFIFTRVLIGFGEGMTVPAMYVVLSKWSPRLERTQFGAFAMAGGNIGNVLGLSLTGVLSEDSVGGWPVSFYVFGCLGLVWVLAWWLLVYESPSVHPRISVMEQVYIVTTAGDRTEPPPTPWKAILTSVPLWAIVAAHVGKNWVYFTLLTSLPLYMEQVLHFDISQNGLLSSLPYLAMWLVEIVGSQFLDLLRRRKLISTTVARKVVNSVGVVLTAVFLVVEGYIGCDKVASVTMLALAVGALGLTSSGFQVNHLDLAPPFAGTLMGITNDIATIPGVITPLVVSAITEGKPFVGRWQLVFFLAAVVNLVGGFIFAIFSSGKEQPWARVHKASKHASDDYHSTGTTERQ